MIPSSQVLPLVHESLVDAGVIEHRLFSDLVVARPFGPDECIE